MDEWVKPSELAELHGVSRRTVWNWVEKGVAEKRDMGPRTGVRVRLVDATEKVQSGEER